MKYFVFMLLGLLVVVVVFVVQVVEILCWECMLLVVLLKVGYECIVFIDCNVCVGVFVGVGECLWVQSVGGVVYLCVSELIEFMWL